MTSSSRGARRPKAPSPSSVTKQEGGVQVTLYHDFASGDRKPHSNWLCGRSRRPDSVPVRGARDHYSTIRVTVLADF